MDVRCRGPRSLARIGPFVRHPEQSGKLLIATSHTSGRRQRKLRRAERSVSPQQPNRSRERRLELRGGLFESGNLVSMGVGHDESDLRCVLAKLGRKGRGGLYNVDEMGQHLLGRHFRMDSVVLHAREYRSLASLAAGGQQPAQAAPEFDGCQNSILASTRTFVGRRNSRDQSWSTCDQ